MGTAREWFEDALAAIGLVVFFAVVLVFGPLIFG